MKSKHKILLAVTASLLGVMYVYAKFHIPVDRLVLRDKTVNTAIKFSQVVKSTSSTTAGSMTRVHSGENLIQHRIYNRKSPSTAYTHSGVDKITKNSHESVFSLLNPFAPSTDNPIPTIDSVQSISTINPTRSESNTQNSLTQNLIEVAFNDLYESSDRLNTDPLEIEFTFSPLKGVWYLSNPAVVELFDTVYAHISPSQRCATCIFKWQHKESGEIEMLATATLFSAQPHTIFITPENGWKNGLYVMSVYDAGKSNQLLGRSSLSILNVYAETLTNAPDAGFIQSLLNQGKAFSKTALIPGTNSTTETAVPNYEYIESLLNSGQAVSKSN